MHVIASKDSAMRARLITRTATHGAILNATIERSSRLPALGKCEAMLQKSPVFLRKNLQ